MKNIVKTTLRMVLFVVLAAIIFQCRSLENEPMIPEGHTNIKNLRFDSTIITQITNDSINAKAKFGDLGNLNIRYGWVYGTQPWPDTLVKTKKIIKNPNANSNPNSFELGIGQLSLNTIYYIRPFAQTGADTFYGKQESFVMNVPKMETITINLKEACQISFNVTLTYSEAYPPREFGLVYSKTQTEPILIRDATVQGSNLNGNVYEAALINLEPATTYHIRSYAISAANLTVYGQSIPVTTPARSFNNVNFTLELDTLLFQGAVVEFTNTTQGTASFTWDFGDGTTSQAPKPEHVFGGRIGNTKVKLVAKEGGCVDMKERLLIIVQNPFAQQMITVDGGQFIMGCTGNDCEPSNLNDAPQHRVELNTFKIGRTEVTQQQWKAVTGENPSRNFRCLECPVEQVTWDMINEEGTGFLAKLYKKTGIHYRLPTEAEWEFAARGGNKSKGYFFSGGAFPDTLALYMSTSLTTQKAGSHLKKPNELGLFDMSGNVEEWCEDYYQFDYYGEFLPGIAKNPKCLVEGDDILRVLRGGSFLKQARDITVYYRNYDDPSNNPAETYGFRLALSQ